jgi:hypothetical protein
LLIDRSSMHHEAALVGGGSFARERPFWPHTGTEPAKHAREAGNVRAEVEKGLALGRVHFQSVGLREFDPANREADRSARFRGGRRPRPPPPPRPPLPLRPPGTLPPFNSTSFDLVMRHLP